MKHIEKKAELQTLTRHRLQPHAGYDNYVEKDELRAALLSEQGGICCYCMQRISMAEIKVEHFASQKKYPHRRLEYDNLLAACLGGQGSPRHLQHCDTHKGDDDIKLNPTDGVRNCEHFVRYAPDGRIYSDHADINCDLHTTLNLNLQTLKSNRKAVLDGAIEVLRRRRPDGQWVRAFLEAAKKKWQGRGRDGSYAPYCQIVVVYLDRKLRRL